MKKEILSVLLIVILGFAVYSNALKGEFIWDDLHLVKDNPYIKSFSYLGAVFSKGILGGVGKESSFYRPLQLISYMLDYKFYGVKPAGFHLTNILLHIMAALAVYFLVLALFKDRLLSLVTGLLFVVHPVHTEAVTYIAGRADSLVCIFMLLSFIFYIKRLDTGKGYYYLLTLIAYALALLSRENALIFGFLLLFYHYAFKRKIDYKTFLSVVAVSLIYILVRMTLLKAELAPERYSTTLFQRLPGSFAALASYLRLLVLPFHLHMEYGDTLFSWADLKVLAGMGLAVSGVIWGVRNREKNSLVFFSIGFFFLLLIPQLNLYPLSSYMAEHWLYIPSLGFFLLAAGYPARLIDSKHKVLGISILIAVLGFFSFLTFKENVYWLKPLPFYSRTLQYNPQSPRLLNNLGNLYHDLGQDEEAVSLLRKAMDVDPERAATYYNLGNVFRDRKDNSQAVGLYRKAIELDPGYCEAYNNLGLALFEAGKRQEGIDAFNKLIEINPDYAEAYNNLGNAYHAVGKREEALASFNKALDLDPDYYEVYNNLGLAHFDAGRVGEAIDLYKKAIKLDPGYAPVYSNLGIAYHSRGQIEEATQAFKKAIEIDPKNSAAYSNLGVVYNSQGKPDQATALYEQALSVRQDPEIYNNLGITYKAQGKREEAKAAYQKAIEIDPAYAKAYYNLANLYTDTAEHEQAIELYRKTVGIIPFAQAYNNMGLSLYTLGRNNEAIKAYKDAIALDPGYAPTYSNLAIVYVRLGDFESAVKYCDKASELGFKNQKLIDILEPYREGK